MASATDFAELLADDPDALIRLPLSCTKEDLAAFRDFLDDQYAENSMAERVCDMIRDVELWMDLEALIDTHDEPGALYGLLGLEERYSVYPDDGDDNDRELRFVSKAATRWLKRTAS